MPTNTEETLLFEDLDVKNFAHWLALELAPTIFGSKPATILSMVDTKQLPLLKMWERYGRMLLEGATTHWMILAEGNQRLTVLFYRRDILEKCIVQKSHALFLRCCGYPVDEGLDKCLEILKDRFRYCCPHEVGLLLGIPLKDVLGFMGMTGEQLTCRGEWCVYGDPECSLQTMRQFAADRVYVSELVKQGVQPYHILRGWSKMSKAS